MIDNNLLKVIEAVSILIIIFIFAYVTFLIYARKNKIKELNQALEDENKQISEIKEEINNSQPIEEESQENNESAQINKEEENADK